MENFRFSKFLPLFDWNPTIPLVHRDLSWLQFNERVLAEAQKPSNPILERVKFLAISASNLDEFFAIRVASLDISIAKAKKKLDLSKAQRLIETKAQLLKGLDRFGETQRTTLKEIAQELTQHSIYLHLDTKRKEPSYLVAKELFNDQILSHLPPPERFGPKALTSLESLQGAMILPDGVWVRIPKNLPQILGKKASKGKRWDFFFQDHLIALFLGPPSSSQWTAGLLRLTRDGEYEYDLSDTDTESIPDLVKSRIGIRERGKPIRLQVYGNLPNSLKEQSRKSLGLEENQVFDAPGTLFLQSLWTVYRTLQEDFGKTSLYFQTSPPRLPPVFTKTENLFEKIKEKDILLHHPYDSFDGFVRFIELAGKDPHVSSIEITIYRMDALSPVLDFLKHAAQHKKVSVVIELRARFDEWNNLSIASELKKAGVKVAYGFGKLKLHAKVALITRKEGKHIQRYTHLSTGNYHSATARSYTDLAILTANDSIGMDARHFFDSVYKGVIPDGFSQWVVAPQNLSRKIQNLIHKETEAAKSGKPARIFAKVNALVDEQTIEALYKASQAGVKVDLLVRGACSLIPGIKGMSENIRVLSIVDFFLEHSRIYFFENSRKLYLSSADWMPRNFLRRLEIAFPVLDDRIYRYLTEVVIPTYLKDSVQARELSSQGAWKHRNTKKGEIPIRAQFFFKELADKQYRGTPLE